jgi:hypothetical protein
MTHAFNHLTAILLCLTGILGVQAQSTYLLRYEHQESRHADKTNLFFYMEELPVGTIHNQPNLVTLEDAQYRLYYIRLRETSASSYFGCDKYRDQAAGEELSVHGLLSDSVLLTYEQKQQAIEAQSLGLLSNRGRANAVLTIDIDEQTQVKMVKINFDLCTCKVSRASFSSVSDTLAMPRKILQTGIFSEAEKAYWKNHVYYVLDNAFVRHCLPLPDKFVKAYQVGQN